jgi:hypothetical protein
MRTDLLKYVCCECQCGPCVCCRCFTQCCCFVHACAVPTNAEVPCPWALCGFNCCPKANRGCCKKLVPKVVKEVTLYPEGNQMGRA